MKIQIDVAEAVYRCDLDSRIKIFRPRLGRSFYTLRARWLTRAAPLPELPVDDIIQAPPSSAQIL